MCGAIDKSINLCNFSLSIISIFQNFFQHHIYILRFGVKYSMDPTYTAKRACITYLSWSHRIFPVGIPRGREQIYFHMTYSWLVCACGGWCLLRSSPWYYCDTHTANPVKPLLNTNLKRDIRSRYKPCYNVHSLTNTRFFLILCLFQVSLIHPCILGRVGRGELEHIPDRTEQNTLCPGIHPERNANPSEESQRVALETSVNLLACL